MFLHSPRTVITMINVEKLYTPKSLKEALEINEQCIASNNYAAVIGGGNSFFSHCNRSSDMVISLADVPELRCVFADTEDNLVIGAATTFTDLLSNPLIQRYIPSISFLVGEIGTATFRNTATLGGNLCKKEGVRETSACLCAYEAVLQIERGEEKRLLAISEFYAADGSVCLEEGEILTAIIIEKSAHERTYGSSYRYVTHDDPNTTLMCCSANVILTPDRTRFERLRLSYVCESQPPRRLSEAEILAEGSGIFPADISPITAAILHSISSEDGGELNHDFIVHLVRETAKIVIARSIELAKSKS